MVANPRFVSQLEGQKGLVPLGQGPTLPQAELAKPMLRAIETKNNLQSWSGSEKRRLEMRESDSRRDSSFALNTLDEDCKIRHEKPRSSDGLRIMFQEWSGLSQSERERFLQVAIGNDPVTGVSRLDLMRQYSNSGGLSATGSGRVPSKIATSEAHSKNKSRSKLKGKALKQSKSVNKKRKEYIEENTDDEDWDLLPRSKDLPQISFRVDEKDKVESFIYTRFMQIQQSALKVIAKAWIKAICPKKQANFPYVDCNPRHDQPRRRPRHPGPPRVPIFWPKLEDCRHREPDHLDKSERTLLLVHLIHLNWGEDEWKKSNGDTSAAPPFIRSGDWVQFLQESFPPERLTEVTGSSPEKTQQRMQYLRDIYRVALTEQEFHQGGNDGSATFTFSGDVKLVNPRVARPRRHRQGTLKDDNTRTEAADEWTTPISANVATAESVGTHEEYVESPVSDGVQRVLVETSPGENARRMSAPEVHRANMAILPNETTMSPGMWTIVSGDDKTAGPVSQANATYRGFKSETATQPPAYYGQLTNYGNAQSGLDASTLWSSNLVPDPGPYRALQTSFSGSSISGGESADVMYREDLAALDPMLGGMSLRSGAMGVSPYEHEHAAYTFAYDVAGRMMCPPGVPQAQVSEGVRLNSMQSGCGEQQRQFGYGIQAADDRGHGLPPEVKYTMQMANENGHDYMQEQSGSMLGYGHF